MRQPALAARRGRSTGRRAGSCPASIGRYYTQMLALAGIYAIVAQGLNLLAGYTGQASLGHAGFYAIGAYTRRAARDQARASDSGRRSRSRCWWRPPPAS